MNKKPARQPAPDSSTSTILVGLAVLAAVAFAIYHFSREAAPRPLQVEVYMNKQCELVDGAFMAMSEPDGARANFDKGLAVLQTYSNSKIVIRANPAYPSFSYESSKVQASPKVVITVNCDTGRIDNTLDAMRQQFRSRER